MKRRDAIGCALILLFTTATAPSAEKGALTIDEQVLAQLDALRKEQKFVDRFGIIRPEERSRLEPLINDLVDRLRTGIKAHPEESWVIAQMEPTVEAFHLEDTELREPCVGYLMRIFRIVGMKGANGAFKKYYLDF
jgi:hypothetical protein